MGHSILALFLPCLLKETGPSLNACSWGGGLSPDHKSTLIFQYPRPSFSCIRAWPLQTPQISV